VSDVSSTIAARIDRLPHSNHIRKLIILLSLGGWFELYDLFFTAYIAVGLFKAQIFTPTTAALFGMTGFASFVAASFAGLFIGTIAFSWLADSFGRRSIFTFALLWYSAGS
jgi:MFS transporter, putative metabolite:H+ symporter